MWTLWPSGIHIDVSLDGKDGFVLGMLHVVDLLGSAKAIEALSTRVTIVGNDTILRITMSKGVYGEGLLARRLTFKVLLCVLFQAMLYIPSPWGMVQEDSQCR